MMSELMNIVVAGHVDHGKSSVIGRLLTDTESLPDGKLARVRQYCSAHSKPFEYAFLVDALKHEQEQGITIDAARVFFRTKKRAYIIIDAPGHKEFLKNMVTGASRADAALLVIDASEGIQENTRRHGYLLSMVGIRQIVVLVNKMDLVDYQEAVFNRIVTEYRDFLSAVGVCPARFIPVSAIAGENIVGSGTAMPWYRAAAVVDTLDSFSPEKDLEHKPFRMPVQDVYKFTRFGDNRRIVAGTVESGTIAAGDEIVFYPSGKKSRVRQLEAFFPQTPVHGRSGCAVGLTLTEQIYITRGEIACRADEVRPQITSRLRVSLFWLNPEPLTARKEYLLKLGTAKAGVTVERIERCINAADLSISPEPHQVERFAVAECILKLTRAIAVDEVAQLSATSRFVLVDNYAICGGGIVREACPDAQTPVRNRVLVRNDKWERSLIAPEQRAARYRQPAVLVIVTGAAATDKKTLAKQLELELFRAGNMVYFIGIGNVVYGVDADIKHAGSNCRQEHIRRLAEVAYLMLDAGMILIVTAGELTQADVELIQTAVPPEQIEVVWVGTELTTDLICDLHFADAADTEERLRAITSRLQNRTGTSPARQE